MIYIQFWVISSQLTSAIVLSIPQNPTNCLSRKRSYLMILRKSNARYEVLTATISEGEHRNPMSIVQQIANSIKTLYYRRFPDAAATECDDVVTYNPITSRVIFRNLVRSSYLIAAFTNTSIISMFGHGARSFKIRASSERDIDVLPVETENSAASITWTRNLLPPIEKVNLRTLDNVFLYGHNRTIAYWRKPSQPPWIFPN